ncbi:Pyruvate decarboxylase 3 [Senna tora]|uniref:Pyruvate decarboxylase 3 n=1 Tax=Senna tora TaxID=362788 RepID=A0A834SZS7_9FABA|nr:Pyruvate decarboxylase 3 [Senna tora]
MIGALESTKPTNSGLPTRQRIRFDQRPKSVARRPDLLLFHSGQLLCLAARPNRCERCVDGAWKLQFDASNDE